MTLFQTLAKRSQEELYREKMVFKTTNDKKATISTYKIPFYNLKTAIGFSLSVIPQVLKLIKNLIYFAIAAVSAILTLGQFSNANQFAKNQFKLVGFNIRHAVEALIVPFYRVYYTGTKGFIQSQMQKAQQSGDSIEKSQRDACKNLDKKPWASLFSFEKDLTTDAKDALQASLASMNPSHG